MRSQVLLALWEKFRANGIRTPLGHRDLLIKPDSALTVRLDGAPSRRADLMDPLSLFGLLAL